MPAIEAKWARASSLRDLEAELSRLLEGCSADDVLGVSHSTAVLSSKQSGGVWSGVSHTHKVEYSALVLLRS
jgi:hypothetical protein